LLRAFGARLALLQVALEEGNQARQDEKGAAEDERGGVAFRFRVQVASDGGPQPDSEPLQHEEPAEGGGELLLAQHLGHPRLQEAVRP